MITTLLTHHIDVFIFRYNCWKSWDMALIQSSYQPAKLQTLD